MAQHTLRSQYHQRLPPGPQGLTPEQVEILSRRRGLADLKIVHRSELQKAFETRTGVLRSLAFIAVRQKHHKPGQEIPFGFTRHDELIDDCLCDIREIPKLRLPEHQGLRIVAAVAIFEA